MGGIEKSQLRLREKRGVIMRENKKKRKKQKTLKEKRKELRKRKKEK